MEAIEEISENECSAFFGDIFYLVNIVNNEESIETVVVPTMGGVREVDHEIEEIEDERNDNEKPETVSNVIQILKFASLDQ
ncbi:hypothetical protein DPMN_138113 [Dreissena polymorpha]|uniref:Uncharacterized protein n=1 Tax=Dreissena polymorpha TaxID=45954 RepID=A0A9D4JEC0_DREPO|nr:hypothetical protein DPMN_138113 [Dreissena polymorpha]